MARQEPATTGTSKPAPIEFLVALIRVRDVAIVLLTDVNAHHDMLMSETSSGDPGRDRDRGQFLLRSYVRAFFAQVEGVTFAMQGALLELHETGLIKLSAAEHSLLSQVRYFLDKGRPKSARAYSSPQDAFRYTFDRFAAAFGAQVTLDIEQVGWGRFLDSQRIRNAVTHPKSVQDLLLTTDAIRNFGDAIGWFSKEMARLLQACLERTASIESERTVVE